MHVLGTPPAFVLSQDQTLRQRSSSSPSTRRGGRRRLRSRLDPGDLTATEAHHPSERAREDGRCRGSLQGTVVLAHPLLPGCSIEPSSGVERSGYGTRSCPPRIDGVSALAFHTLLSFQGASSGSPLATPLWFPIRSRRRSAGHRISGLPGSSTERPVSPGYPRGSHRLALADP